MLPLLLHFSLCVAFNCVSHCIGISWNIGTEFNSIGNLDIYAGYRFWKIVRSVRSSLQYLNFPWQPNAFFCCCYFWYILVLIVTCWLFLLLLIFLYLLPFLNLFELLGSFFFCWVLLGIFLFLWTLFTFCTCLYLLVLFGSFRYYMHQKNL